MFGVDCHFPRSRVEQFPSSSCDKLVTSAKDFAAEGCAVDIEIFLLLHLVVSRTACRSCVRLARWTASSWNMVVVEAAALATLCVVMELTLFGYQLCVYS